MCERMDERALVCEQVPQPGSTLDERTNETESNERTNEEKTREQTNERTNKRGKDERTNTETDKTNELFFRFDTLLNDDFFKKQYDLEYLFGF